MKANRRDFIALMGGLALVTPHLELPTPLPELVMDGFDDGDEYVWINGQPLRGVQEIDCYDECFPLFGGVGKYIYYRTEGPFLSTIRLRGGSTEQTYRDFYGFVEHHYYEPLDVILIQAPSGLMTRLRHQQMALREIGNVRNRWESPESVFGYPSYKLMDEWRRLPEETAREAWGIYLELTSKEPYDEWRWWTNEPTDIEYKRHNLRYTSAKAG